MRTITTNAPQAPNTRISDDFIHRSYTITTITPVFGGGHEAGFVETDDAVVVRGTSVRGHLRFWWRATQGLSYENVETLFQREGEIWGTTKEPGKVSIALDIISFKRERCGTNNGKFISSYPSYALFSFQPNNKDATIRDCITDLTYTLHVTCPADVFTHVESALSAWVNFGGIGSRTRRGCGALYCEEFAPDSLSTLNDWYKRVYSYCAGMREWPTLPDGFLWKSQENNDPIAAWSEVIFLFKKFRQDYPVGRNQGQGSRPGRSRWPEPESIRKVTTGWKGKHQRLESIPDDAFPRAELGLPIIFQFPGGGPSQTTLYPIVDGNRMTRMSSPLILRPLRCKNGEVAQIVMRLCTGPLKEVVLEGARGEPHFKKIRSPDLSHYPGSPMGPSASPRSMQGSALEAFIAYAQEKENRFLEVRK